MQFVDLDVVGFVVILGELVRVVGDEGEVINGVFQVDVVVGWVKSEDGGVLWSLSGLGEGVVVEGFLM